MTEDVWSAEDTTPDHIESALRELLRERHAANQALAPARVLNLVVVVDRDWKGEISNRLQRVGRYNASRTVLCAVEEGRKKLDARAVMRYEEPADGSGLGVMLEEVEIDLGPEQLEHLETVIDPVIVSELPTMLWSPHGHDEAVRAVLELVDAILLDSDDLADPPEAFARATELLRSAYVVDLAWLRTTPWRERVAASFDPANRRATLNGISKLVVRHQPASAASATLLAGWLCSRLRWEPGSLGSGDGAGLRSVAGAPGGAVDIELEPVEQEVPGLVGVTVGCGERFSLSLDRGPGGLRAHELPSDRTWRVLGASRGEAGILGEGVRQALLRDPTYGPALSAARRLSG
jgi:glucose-6-phosphate dehydrogenase assembly protein OpcA